MSNGMPPIIVVGAGPVGLTTALGLYFYGLPFALFEDDAELSLDTKAGTILARTLEAFRRYGVAEADADSRRLLTKRHGREQYSSLTVAELGLAWLTAVQTP